MFPATADTHGSRTQQAIELMRDFAERTGLSTPRQQRRYLWTDAFAVCNFLALWQASDDTRYLDQALLLIDKVHGILGRHRTDDQRLGWLSGLDGEEALHHPTRGGLRIGKKLPERRHDEPPDADLEWERDGQYFHYLTKWMHALDQTSRLTHQPKYNRWARELADVAHDAFQCQPSQSGLPRMVWKMSIDLSRPLVRSMGQHDPLDGYITCAQLRATASALGTSGNSSLQNVQEGFAAMSASGGWATSDPLGIGGLLWDARRVSQLAGRASRLPPDLVPALLHAALSGLRLFVTRHTLAQPAASRVAFRELGLSIGLRAIEAIQAAESAYDAGVASVLKSLHPYSGLAEEIEAFWLDPWHRQGDPWRAHRDINEVMLATCLVPCGLTSLTNLE